MNENNEIKELGGKPESREMKKNIIKNSDKRKEMKKE